MGRATVLEIEHHGRHSIVSTGDELSTCKRLFAAVDAIAKPGQKLFIGPADFRRTPYNETLLYYFFPKLRPNSYYLEMDPNVCNRQGSRLLPDLLSSDVLILSNSINNWNEPNASSLLGSSRPNEIVKERFVLREKVGPYDVYSAR